MVEVSLLQNQKSDDELVLRRIPVELNTAYPGMQLCVKNSSSRSSRDTINNVKQMIQDKEGISAGQQRLVRPSSSRARSRGRLHAVLRQTFK